MWIPDQVALSVRRTNCGQISLKYLERNSRKKDDIVNFWELSRSWAKPDPDHGITRSKEPSLVFLFMTLYVWQLMESLIRGVALCYAQACTPPSALPLKSWHLLKYSSSHLPFPRLNFTTCCMLRPPASINTPLQVHYIATAQLAPGWDCQRHTQTCSLACVPHSSIYHPQFYHA